MKSRGYRLTVVEEEDGSWTIEAPDLPGMVAAGATLSAAAREIPDAIDSWIQAATAAGMPVPAPTRGEEEYSGRFLMRVAKTLHRRLAERARQEGVSLNTYCVTILAGAVERPGSATAPIAWSALTKHGSQGLPGTIRPRPSGGLRRLPAEWQFGPTFLHWIEPEPEGMVYIDQPDEAPETEESRNKPSYALSG